MEQIKQACQVAEAVRQTQVKCVRNVHVLCVLVRNYSEIQCAPRALLWSYGGEGGCYNDNLPVYRSRGEMSVACLCVCVSTVRHAGNGQ